MASRRSGASPPSPSPSPSPSPESCGDPGTAPAAELGDELIGSLWSPCARLVGVDLGWLVEQRADDSPGFLDVVLAGEPPVVSDHGGMQEDFVWRRALAALLGELHLEVDLLGVGGIVSLGIEVQPDPRARMEPDDQLVGLQRM